MWADLRGIDPVKVEISTTKIGEENFGVDFLPGTNVDLRNKTREIYPTQTTGDDLDPLNQKCRMWHDKYVSFHALEEAN